MASVAPPFPEGPLDASGPPPATGAPRGGPSPAGPGPEIALLPRGVGEVVDTAIGLYRRNWTLLTATAAVIVPVQLLVSFANRNVVPQLGDMVRSIQRGPASGTTTISVGTPGTLLAFLALPLLTVALATVAASCYMGRPITPGRAWRATMGRFWAVLGLGLLRFLLVGLGLFLFLVPGIFLYIRLLVAPVVLVVEGAGPVSALERSWRLTGGQWWRTCGAQVLKGVTVLFGYALIETPMLILSVVAGPGWLFLAIGASLTQLLIAPFLVAVTVVIYFDLRIRKEGFDLAVTAQRLQSPLPA